MLCDKCSCSFVCSCSAAAKLSELALRVLHELVDSTGFDALPVGARGAQLSGERVAAGVAAPSLGLGLKLLESGASSPVSSQVSSRSRKWQTATAHSRVAVTACSKRHGRDRRINCSDASTRPSAARCAALIQPTLRGYNDAATTRRPYVSFEIRKLAAACDDS